MTIDDLRTKGEISVRSYHVCKYNKLYTIAELINRYNKRGTFRFLKNCGEKSNDELIAICNNFKEIYFENNELELKEENPLKLIISELTRIQREVINSFILVNTNSLSVRSKNAITLHLEDNLKIKNFADKILLSEKFIVKNIKNIGAKCIPELGIYINIIKDFLIEVGESKNEKHLVSLKNNFLIQRTFSITKIPNEILESESIFLLVDFLLNKNAFFDEAQTIILKNALKIYQDTDELTLDDIALKVNLSRERVRQIRKICLDHLHNKLLFIQNFNDDLLQKYNININSNHIELSSDTVKIINYKNSINLSREFITFILYSYLYDSFLLIGNIEDVLQPKYFNARNRHNWNNFYLIKKNIVSEIDFNSFAEDVSIRINNRIEESYSFNFKSYLSKFLINNNIEILDLAFSIAEKIVNEEFELYLDLDENIIFKRTSNKQANEYAYEALEQLGKPSKVLEIFEKVIELYPNYDTEEAKIRSSMKRNYGFVPVGRKSVFGLKKWENELENFKGGTIRDIAEEYLSQYNIPKHISEITNYVLIYRPKSNQYSILQNLKLDESGLYIFFKGSQIGLSTKKYDDIFKKVSIVEKGDPQSWQESLEDLKNFISKENRLPYSSGCPKSEEKLYRWFNVQKRKCSYGGLESEKEKLIIDINIKFPQNIVIKLSNSNYRNKSTKPSFRSKYSLSELISFIKKHKKIPDSRDIDERNLYQFYYRIVKNLKINKAKTIEEIELIQLIDEYGSTRSKSVYKLIDLITFIKNNQRIPNPQEENEINLYHYYHRQKRKILNLKYFSDDEQKLQNLISQYKSTNIRVIHNIEELINFITTNSRLPNPRKLNESKLYQFYYRKKNLFENNKLDKEEENQFIEIAKNLQKIKYEIKRN